MKKVALVTGGSRGIGYGVCQSLAKEGYNIVIGDIRDEKETELAVQELSKMDCEVLYIQTDVSNLKARKKLLREIDEHFGCLHVLVNNAGVAPKERKDILDASEESFDWVISVNLKGPYFLTQLTANWMIKQKKSKPDFSGYIVNISSVSSTVASPNRGEYCISKAGISMATKLWAVRLAEFNILVYEVRPGIIRTDMTAAVKTKYDKMIAEGLLLQSRWGMPEDVGKTVASLVRGDLPYSTGQVVMVDGGLTINRL